MVMPFKEKTGIRDLGYSLWHRKSLPRYATTTDIDFVEYCPECFEPLVIIETAYGLDNLDKVHTNPIPTIKKLASKALIPFYVVLYEGESEGESECPLCHRPFARTRIAAFRKKLIYPREGYWTDMSVDEYREWLLSLHIEHRKYCKAGGVKR
jgi:hypothetical protein